MRILLQWHDREGVRASLQNCEADGGADSFGHEWSLVPVRNVPACFESDPACFSEDGGGEEWFSTAAHVVNQTCRGPYQAHAPFGPGCALADVNPDSATIMCSTQNVYAARANVARVLGIPAEKVRIQYYEGTGAYGHSCYDDAAQAAAILSQAAGKPENQISGQLVQTVSRMLEGRKFKQQCDRLCKPTLAIQESFGRAADSGRWTEEIPERISSRLTSLAAGTAMQTCTWPVQVSTSHVQACSLACMPARATCTHVLWRARQHEARARMFSGVQASTRLCTHVH